MIVLKGYKDKHLLSCFLFWNKASLLPCLLPLAFGFAILLQLVCLSTHKKPLCTMASPYYLAVTTQSQYTRLFKSEEMSKLSEFSSTNRIASNSWGRENLFAYHVIVAKSTLDFLPFYQGEESTYRENTSDGDKLQLTQFINGIKKEEVEGRFEHQLTHTFGFSLGQVWAALHSVKKGANKSRDFTPVYCSPDNRSPNHKRPRRNVPVQNYRAASQDSDPVKPPLSQSSNSSYAGDVMVKDLQSEDHTMRLITCILRHILNYTQGQDEEMDVEVREREQLSLSLPRIPVTSTSIDDGGLCLRYKGVDGTAERIALLEAKKRLHIVDRKPQLSDEVLRQMACEAILAKANRRDEVCGNK